MSTIRFNNIDRKWNDYFSG